MNKKAKTILVTGAAGYLASWIIKQLLEAGHNVHGTVRDLHDKAKIVHLLKDSSVDNIRHEHGELKLFEANLLNEGSFDEAANGCDIVIHVASPYFLEKPKDIQKMLINPAVSGTKNVLNSASKTNTVKRIIVTSSIVTLFNNAKDLYNKIDNKVSENDINKNTKRNYNPYAFSKTKAERIAWEINKSQDQWDLITVHPGAIFGPSLSNLTDATSIKMMIQFLNGSFKIGVPNLRLGVVDVRDVANIHIQAALNRSAKGKYIAVAKTLTLLEISNLLKLNSLNIKNKLPRRELPKVFFWLIAPFVGMQRKYVANNVNCLINFDNKKSILELGVNYIPPERTLNNHAEQLIKNYLI